MPIFEFRCCDCGSLFEKLFMSSNEEVNIECPECRCTSIERVVSRTHHVMGTGTAGKKPKMSTKSCSPGSNCTTLELPGHTR